jgi:hypothetical protein
MSKGEARLLNPPRHLGKLSWGFCRARSWWVKYRRLQITIMIWP